MSEPANPVTLSFCTADEWAEYAAQKDGAIARLTAERDDLAALVEAQRAALEAHRDRADLAVEQRAQAIAERDAWRANAERLAGLLADAVEDESEFDTEWDVEVRAALAAHANQNNGDKP